MTTYDSKAEESASADFARLGCIRANGHYPHTFTDADGTDFRARPDFFHEHSGLHIEFKASALNSRTTKATAERAESRRRTRKGILTRWDWLQCGWNHAKAKQAIVQRKLTPQKFAVVFKEPPTIAEAVDYQKAGIVFIPLAALSSYLLHARLARAGIKTAFALRYETEEAGPIVLALGPYDAAAWLHRDELAKPICA